MVTLEPDGHARKPEKDRSWMQGFPDASRFFRSEHRAPSPEGTAESRVSLNRPFGTYNWPDKFDDPNLPGEMQVTITLKKVSCGTELNIVQEEVPGIIPVEACYLGWQESLTLLAKLVEAEIPDQP